MSKHHDHGGACDCAAHRKQRVRLASVLGSPDAAAPIERDGASMDATNREVLPSGAPPSSAWARWLGSLLPVLACAVCPACLATYAKAASMLGLGATLTEGQHGVLLTVAVTVSIGMSLWRARQTGRRWPLVPNIAGCALLVMAHVVEQESVLPWVGIGLVLAGALWERASARRPAQLDAEPA